MCYLAPYINPTHAWIFPFFATSYFWLLICNLLFIAFWWTLKNKIWLLSFFAILLGVQHIGSYIGLSVDSSQSSDLSVMTYNVGGQFQGKSPEEAAAKKEGFIKLIRTTSKPDILSIQEAGWVQFYKDSLAYKNSYNQSGTAILTDLEIIHKGSIDFENTSNRLIWVDVKVEDKILRVVNVHLQSNKVSDQADDLILRADFKEKKTWRNVKSVISKIKHATKMRTLQTLESKAFIETSPYPVLLMGDFNDTPLSYTYRHISDNMQDAFCKKGNGLGMTYAGNIPGLRIDYILGSQDIKFTSYESPKVDFSDHYPIVCHLSLSGVSDQ